MTRSAGPGTLWGSDLGDIVVSVPFVARHSAVAGLDTHTRLLVRAGGGGWRDGPGQRVLAHGLMHLLGHTHQDDLAHRRMLGEERRVLGALYGEEGLEMRDGCDGELWAADGVLSADAQEPT